MYFTDQYCLIVDTEEDGFVTLKLEDKWIWDFWLVTPQDADDGKWHCYFLQADKSLPDPEMRHRNVSQGHAISDDLINWTYLGTSFKPAETKSWDDWTTWTGSVVKDNDGLWHLFYTGTMRDLEGMHQRIGHATSKDMHNFKRVGDGLALDRVGPNAKYYEEYTPGHWHDRAMRDPWVIRNPKGAGWLMYFTARVPGREEPNAGGAVGFATSPDLYTWTLQKPIYDGGAFGQLEVPQVFKRGQHWYMTFCTHRLHWSKAYRKFNKQKPLVGNHYLMAKSHLGPWHAPKPFLDGTHNGKRYAGKIVDWNGKLHILGFLHRDGRNKFTGEVSNPVPLKIEKNGQLTLDE
jgi:beta-fructofuranosidase